ncbi:MAG TPA: CooT family nickel-binding protein [Candidatus Bathyarchaeota archaeon]|nr:CooT family nickel-binding protein [Candidatus Bathyarchaeota archaeon]HEW89852.1 CooT family nickel-binding protein [Candidatus Bathyarchaeota archaeon]
MALGREGMCEFKVFLDGRLVAEDIIYAREEGSSVVLRSVIGSEKRVDDCRIIEVDTLRERLILARKAS